MSSGLQALLPSACAASSLYAKKRKFRTDAPFLLPLEQTGSAAPAYADCVFAERKKWVRKTAKALPPSGSSTGLSLQESRMLGNL